MTFSFGESEHERIEVDVLRYERDPAGDFHDDNWLTVKIQVKAGGFHGKADAAILTAELVGFMEQMRALHDTLKGSAEFNTLEEQLKLHLAGDGRGHIELRGEVSDQPGIGNRLHFSLSFDQTQLGASIRELERVAAEFPVREVSQRCWTMTLRTFIVDDEAHARARIRHALKDEPGFVPCRSRI